MFILEQIAQILGTDKLVGYVDGVRVNGSHIR